MQRQRNLFKDFDLGIKYDNKGRPYLEKPPPPKIVMKEEKYHKHILFKDIAVALTNFAVMYRGVSINQNMFTQNHQGYSNWSKVKHWGLAWPEPNLDDPRKNQNGKYHMTELGWRFVRGETTVYSHTIVHEKRFVAFSGELVDIEWAHREEWDYQKFLRDNGFYDRRFPESIHNLVP